MHRVDQVLLHHQLGSLAKQDGAICLRDATGADGHAPEVVSQIQPASVELVDGRGDRPQLCAYRVRLRRRLLLGGREYAANPLLPGVAASVLRDLDEAVLEAHGRVTRDQRDRRAPGSRHCISILVEADIPIVVDREREYLVGARPVFGER